MAKFIKTVFIILITLLLFNINFVSAVDLNITEDNNSSNTTNNTSNNTSSSRNNNTVSNNTNSEENDDDETDYTSSNSYNNVDTSTSDVSGATVRSGNLPESNLGLSNILSIFLIVIGIILILLAIAILIKLK